ncbi:MAG: bifunctional N(6)-L-threonylcarbamoyladenine synthase/serine/threonine protein kinase [Candidatus Thorarchaeota archaeon]|nr:MAG: bifunctional N(6)-L-threonylcarbamoyladenine synthase/serine/threonine protein kinase [Candidatus Thorarchaeota archaeon]
MICLGLEGTAHSFGAGIVSGDGTVLSNVWDMYSPPTGGIHPREASRHHSDVGPTVIRNALERAGISPQEINLIAFSRGPGLGPCLRTTATIARTLALRLSVPLVGVNHCIAHIEIGCLESAFEDPVTVYVSGGNTQIIAYAGKRYRTFGETLDIAVGNMLDSFGRAVGMRFPAGPEIELKAEKASSYHQLPYSVKGMDLSYSGMLTAARKLHSEGTPLSEICFSVQETAFGMLAEIAERAIAHTKKRELLLTGGVARNDRLTDILKGVANRHDARFHRVSPPLAGDQGAMIAWTGVVQHRAGDSLKISDSHVLPKWRTDEQDIVWREVDG